MSPASKHQIVLLHGRGTKPAATELRDLWIQALRAGLERDAPKQVQAFDDADVEMVYFADRLEEFAEPGYDETLDLDNRRQSLQELMAKEKAKDFRRKHYEALPGKTPLKEFAMDVSASLGLGRAALRKVMPELHHYWDADNGWSEEIKSQLTTLLSEHMAAERNVLLISHCMGSVLAWDSLWHMTHADDFAGQERKRITRWITLDSSLGSSAVRNKLAGAY